MAMPEAAVHQDDLSVPREHYVGLAWQVFSVKSKSVAEMMKDRPHDQFRLGVLTADSTH